MKLPILIIGPMHAGKSTIAHLLAEKLVLPEIAVDAIAREKYLAQGINEARLENSSKTDNYFDFFNYVRPYEIDATLKIVQDHPNAVISFGAGHSYADTPELLAKIEILKAITQNIFLLLPSPDISESQKVLEERMDKDKKGKITDERLATRKQANKLLLESVSNKTLASHVIYTKGKTPEQCRDEIISLCL